ncbi:MAG TPA: quinone-dependent dihydroorotate dehydrogenase [Gammaproteobacteria bacterium]|nr:MAG: quinone-dependent dihydroorotate dehydrogenase [OM182 bacterium]HAL41948.1 quinone-dependent dihydroorotate dehydrogenase [Gammaproteobacteria bacterium]|tara:strand:+ start:643 stop:1662 length:1020 start_codon:yes stop_codon:yes gene_type:complete
MRLLQKVLLSLPPEAAHSVAMTGLKLRGKVPGLVRPLLGKATFLGGKALLNPLGLAAGLDKDAEAVEGLARCGFGFLEVGTVTPRAQPGNPKPRLFRLPQHGALINRMGFNNHGLDAMARRLAGVRERGRLHGTLIGVNLGKNKDTPLEHAVDDYVSCMRGLVHLADYFTLNLSSPNTPGLRKLQHGEGLRNLLHQVKEAQLALASDQAPVPLLLKVAPDLADDEITQIAEQVSSIGLEGLIATNTTLARDAVLAHQHGHEAGGLSGRPLTNRSREVVAAFRRLLPDSCSIVGVGGISSADDARAMLSSGASALQIYTSFIYKGPKIVQEIIMGINALK